MQNDNAIDIDTNIDTKIGTKINTQIDTKIKINKNMNTDAGIPGPSSENTGDLLHDFIEINGIPCRIRTIGLHGPIILWGMYPHVEDTFDHLWNCITAQVPGTSFILAAFTVSDWDRDFSPWKASSFEGGGENTLLWVKESCIPWLKKHFGEDLPVYLIGYSLAGLFALWSAYETDLFSGIACCSGSLWFPEWNSYCQTHNIPHPCNIYLSLGGKEEKTANAMMATVGIRTREQEKLLKKDPQVSHVILEWNSGGHFADSGKRLAKGVRWLLSR